MLMPHLAVVPRDVLCFHFFRDPTTEPLAKIQEFARAYCMAGEKVVAADMVSRLNDKFYGQWLMLHVPFKDPVWFFKNPAVREQLKLIPEEHKYFAMARLCPHPAAQAVWQSRDRVEEELKVEAHTRSFRRTLLGMLDANTALVDRYLCKQANAKEEAAERRAQLAAAVPADEDELRLNAQQKRLKSKVDAAVDRAIAVQTAGLGDDVDGLMEEAYKEGKIYVCTGGPGTGKTTVALACVEHARQAGGKVLFVYPTNRQASRMRAKLPKDVDVDTYHAGFGLDQEPGSAAVSLSQYAMIVGDEMSQMQGHHFDHVRKLWNQADNIPAILLLGDEMQIAGYGEQRAWHHPSWRRKTFRVKLHEVYRCKDKAYNKVLQELRTSRPNKQTLKWLKSRKAWTPPGKPTAEGIRKLLKAHPKTRILTCTRKGARGINRLALEAEYPNYPPLDTVDADVESNPNNWTKGPDGAQVLKEDHLLKPTELPIFKGAQVCFTRNVRKDIDYVNGMDATVVDYHPESKAIEVMTATKHRVMVWKWSDMDKGGLAYYPLKAGYADTIMKYQGAELEHVTVFLDAEKVPGAAYTALSRVSYGDNVLIGGNVTAAHFQPVGNS